MEGLSGTVGVGEKLIIIGAVGYLTFKYLGGQYAIALAVGLITFQYL